ncbi:MAG: glycerophosphodiester phosphodiesterase [Clostridia bacterium]|nr:glycerophosphodiester phosphodiesterase [Clostridia bacterium]
MIKALKLPDNFTVTAHTGCEGSPDNSIESVVRSFESGADIFEADVQFDANGAPVLAHDAPVGGEPTLEEIFQKLAGYKNMRCNLDIKRTDNLKIIPVLAEKYGVADRIFYTGIDIDFIEAVKETPQIPYYLNADIAEPENQSEEYLLSLVKRVIDCGAIGINCNHKNVTKKFVDIFRENDLFVSVWTCNEEADMIRILNTAPDNITTRKPSVLKSIIRSVE